MWIAPPHGIAVQKMLSASISAVSARCGVDAYIDAGAAPTNKAAWPSSTSFTWSILHGFGVDHVQVPPPAAADVGWLVTLTTPCPGGADVYLSASTARDSGSEPSITQLLPGVSLSSVLVAGGAPQFFSLRPDVPADAMAALGNFALSWGVSTPGVTVSLYLTNRYVPGDPTTLPGPTNTGKCNVLVPHGQRHVVVTTVDACMQGAPSANWTVAAYVSGSGGSGGGAPFTIMAGYQVHPVQMVLGTAALPLSAPPPGTGLVNNTFSLAQFFLPDASQNLTVQVSRAREAYSPFMCLIPPNKPVKVDSCMVGLIPPNENQLGFQGYHGLFVNADEPCAVGGMKCDAADYTAGLWTVLVMEAGLGTAPSQPLTLLVYSSATVPAANVHDPVAQAYMPFELVCSHHNADGTCHDHGAITDPNAWLTVPVPASAWAADMPLANRTSQYLSVNVQCRTSGCINFPQDSSVGAYTASSSMSEANDAEERLRSLLPEVAEQHPDLAAWMEEELDAGRVSIGPGASVIAISYDVCGPGAQQEACSTDLRFPIPPIGGGSKKVRGSAVGSMFAWGPIAPLPHSFCKGVSTPGASCFVNVFVLLFSLNEPSAKIRALEPMGVEVRLHSSVPQQVSPAHFQQNQSHTTAVQLALPAPNGAESRVLRGSSLTPQVDPWTVFADPYLSSVGSGTVRVRVEACAGSVKVPLCVAGPASSCGASVGTPWSVQTPDEVIMVDATAGPASAEVLIAMSNQTTLVSHRSLVAALVEGAHGVPGRGHARARVMMGDAGAGYLGVMNRTLLESTAAGSSLFVKVEFPSMIVSQGSGATKPVMLPIDEGLTFSIALIAKDAISPEQLAVLQQGSYCGYLQVMEQLSNVLADYVLVERGQISFSGTLPEADISRVRGFHWVVVVAKCAPNTLCAQNPVVGQGVVYEPLLLHTSSTGSDDDMPGNDDDTAHGSHKPEKPPADLGTIFGIVGGVIGGMVLMGVAYVYCRRNRRTVTGAYEPI